jgi:hypothetical protein
MVIFEIFSKPKPSGESRGGKTQVAPSLTHRSIAESVSGLMETPVKKINFNPANVSYFTWWSYTATLFNGTNRVRLPKRRASHWWEAESVRMKPCDSKLQIFSHSVFSGLAG